LPGYCTIRGDVLDYDRRVESLSSDAYRLFMLTLYSPARTMLGVMRFVAADALPRVRGWTEADALAALAELQAVDLVLYDDQARLLFNPMALEFAPIRGANQVKGAAQALRALPDSPVLLPALRQVLDAGQAAMGGKDGRELPEIMAELRRRWEALQPPSDQAPSEPPSRGVEGGSEGASRGVEAPSKGGRRGVEGGSEPPSRGVEAPSEGGMPPSPLYSGLGGDTPTSCGQGKPPRSPLEGGSEGASRGVEGGSEGGRRGSREYARALPNPNPNPENPEPEEDPPKAPPPGPGDEAGGRGMGQKEGCEGKKAEGGSRYEHLDPRKRGSQNGAAAGNA
jgi:hypothetical protein